MLINALIDNYYALKICIVIEEEITVDAALKKMGLLKKAIGCNKFATRRRRENKIFDKDLEDIKKLYFKDKLSLKEIGKIYDCGDTVILNFLKKHGEQTRKRGGNNKKGVNGIGQKR